MGEKKKKRIMPLIAKLVRSLRHRISNLLLETHLGLPHMFWYEFNLFLEKKNVLFVIFNVIFK